jgi:hypothetical protein
MKRNPGPTELNTDRFRDLVALATYAKEAFENGENEDAILSYVEQLEDAAHDIRHDIILP